MSLRNTKLPLEAKHLIVRSLAHREPHATIVQQIHERFGILVNRKAVAHYNPRLNPTLDPSLQSLYEETAAARWREIERETEEWFAKRRQQRQEQEDAQRVKLRAQIRREVGLE